MSTEDLMDRFERILPDVRRIAGAAGTLKKVASRLATLEGYEALRTMEKDLARLEAVDLSHGSLLEQARATATDARAWLEGEWRRRAGEMTEAIVSAFADRGVDLTRRGDLLVAWPLAIALDAPNDEAKLTHAGETVRERLPIVPARLFREWSSAASRLERSAAQPETFADSFIDAYDRIASKRGARVKLPDVHFQMFVQRQTAASRTDPQRAKLKEYPRYQFAYDLALLLESPQWLVRGERTITMWPASESASRSRTGSVEVATREGSRTLGDISA